MKNKLAIFCISSILISCGPNKEERISILKAKIERSSELSKSYKDTLNEIISLQVQKLTYYKDSVLVSRALVLEPNNYDLSNVDTTDYAMSLHALDSAKTNRLTNQIAEIEKELNESKMELDNLLGRK
jgi:hypothetical protein